jgi:aminoglycoside phosphotransferase (APT) family kinase protein
VLEWALRTTACAKVSGHTVRALARGAVADRVEELTLHLTGCPDGAGRTVRVVEKSASRHEVAGLRAAQVVRPAATAIPELVAAGEDETGPWTVTPLLSGTPLPNRDASTPRNLFQSLACLHAYFDGGSGLPEAIPRVDLHWWQRLCRDWVLPQVDHHRDRHRPGTVGRILALVNRAAEHAAVPNVLARLRPTLLHGDVHPGNVILDDQHAWLIDWGSCRIGPAMLDLANLVCLDSDAFAVYRDCWTRLTGAPLDADRAEAGYRWAAVQIPIQYLPWMVENLPTADVEAALDRAERALALL